MKAVIVTGGKQYTVAEGDVVFIEKLPVEAGDTVTFDQVLAVVDENASNFGTPTIAGATVTASVVKNGKAIAQKHSSNHQSLESGACESTSEPARRKPSAPTEATRGGPA